MFNFGTNLGLAVGKYLIKITFDFKIDIFETSNVPDFSKFCALLILRPICAEQAVNTLLNK